MKAEPPKYLQRLRAAEVGKAFIQVAIDLKEIIALDCIDELDAHAGFNILSHDHYGPLPDSIIKDTGDRYPVLDQMQREAAKLIAVVRVRKDLAEICLDCKFLLPTKTDKGVVVGLRFDEKTILAEGPTYWETYHRLMRKAVNKIL